MGRSGNPARRNVVSLGMPYEAATKQHVRIEAPPSGHHLWAMFAMFRVTDPAKAQKVGTVYLDLETLLTLEGPGCFICEQPWTPELQNQPCPGEPNG